MSKLLSGLISYYEKIGDEVACIDEEIPFEIPDSWSWCRLGTLFQHNTGKALNAANKAGTLYEYITTSNVYWDHFELENLKTMPFTEAEIEKCTVHKGDLLVCEGGDIGRAAIWDKEIPIRIQNHIHKLRPYIAIEVKLYYYVFYLYKINSWIEGNGIGLQGLSSNRLHSLPIPLPPLNEQKHLIKNVEDLLELLSGIEASLN